MPLTDRPVSDVSGNGSDGSVVSSGLTPKRETDTDDYLRMVRRVLGGLARRVGEGDITALTEMAMLRFELDEAIEDAVTGLRNDSDLPASWADIGRALGITRQSAQQRFGGRPGLRRAGGQPGNWR